MILMHKQQVGEVETNMDQKNLNLVLTLTVRLQQISLVLINMIKQPPKLEVLLTLMG